tara:strand:+ start:3234 stop:4211 length:978 start_codon:yes stop_codon:yes gene_type:complete
MQFKNQKEIIKKLYYQIYKIRSVETQIAANYKKGEMRCPVHLSIGQEAISVALSQVMRKNDFAVSSHRAHAHYLAKNGSLKKMIAEIYGKVTGCSKGKGGSMHLIDLKSNFMGSTAIVGNTIPIGVGLALSSKIRKQNNFSFIFFGEGAVEEGVFYESVNFAVVKKLPVIFICENNFYSVYSPLKVRQPKDRKIYKLAKEIGIKKSYQCKHYDPQLVYKFISEKINLKDKNSGPYFFEFKTYRWLEHCGPNEDNFLGYREKSDFNIWHKRDALKKIRLKLINIDKDAPKKIEKKVNKEIQIAFEYARRSKFPKQKEAYEGVYAKK